jgi:hypothetical protein
MNLSWRVLVTRLFASPTLFTNEVPTRCLIPVLVCIAYLLGNQYFSLAQGEPLVKPASRGEYTQLHNTSSFDTYGSLPLSFEPNHGQTDSRVKFLSKRPSYTLFFTSEEVVLAFSQNLGNDKVGIRKSQIAEENDSSQRSAVRIRLIGANSGTKITGLNQRAGKANYFRSNDPNQWRVNIPTFAELRHENVYPGVDVIYYGSGKDLEYDFVVAPGADPTRIQLAVEGNGEFSLDNDGDLVLRSGERQLRFHKPLAYQKLGQMRQEVRCSYAQKSAHLVGFEVGSYDRRKPLIIDPVLTYSTYLGGSGSDIGNSIAVDSKGHAYVVGRTQSDDFPTKNPFQETRHGGRDIFVTKLNAEGSELLYSTYIGGSLDENGLGIAVDRHGNAYISGNTTSRDFPTKNAFQPQHAGGTMDVVVFKLNSEGSDLIFSTYFGGSGGFDQGRAIALDAEGNAYVTGNTDSPNFPTTPGAFQTSAGSVDGFVAKFTGQGELVYSTRLHGTNGVATGRGIAVDRSGDAYVAGYTSSVDFPTTAGVFQPAFAGGLTDYFITKLNADGSDLVYSTYVGGSGDEQSMMTIGTSDSGHGRIIAIDHQGNAYLTGDTASLDFPTRNALQPAHGGGAFTGIVTKLNATGTDLIYSTYLGGSGFDSGRSIAVDSEGHAFVAGFTSSTDFPVEEPLQLNHAGGVFDAFVAELSSDGSDLVYSTYLGGSGLDVAWSIAVDPKGNAYVAGQTNSPDFPIKNAVQPDYGGGLFDAFIAKIRSRHHHDDNDE